ncbi:hypothetical protein TNCV_3898491 [Trichonephila clavipes]|nr:hypothetical protein TNCV_3898491 [Trichonephila clavipes]
MKGKDRMQFLKTGKTYYFVRIDRKSIEIQVLLFRHWQVTKTMFPSPGLQEAAEQNSGKGYLPGVPSHCGLWGNEMARSFSKKRHGYSPKMY